LPDALPLSPACARWPVLTGAHQPAVLVDLKDVVSQALMACQVPALLGRQESALLACRERREVNQGGGASQALHVTQQWRCSLRRTCSHTRPWCCRPAAAAQPAAAEAAALQYGKCGRYGSLMVQDQSCRVRLPCSDGMKAWPARHTSSMLQQLSETSIVRGACCVGYMRAVPCCFIGLAACSAIKKSRRNELLVQEPLRSHCACMHGMV
jgi:hypothetical protein